jgi:hypothetical protein
MWSSDGPRWTNYRLIQSIGSYLAFYFTPEQCIKQQLKILKNKNTCLLFSLPIFFATLFPWSDETQSGETSDFLFLLIR